MSWSLCRCCNGAVAVVVLASLPSLRWHHCRCCSGAFAVVVPVSLPSLRWHCCRCCAGIITLLHWHCHLLHCAGVVAIIVMVPSPLRRFFCLCYTGVVSLVVLALLPLLCWQCCSQCTLLPLLRWCCLPCHVCLAFCIGYNYCNWWELLGAFGATNLAEGDTYGGSGPKYVG